jgi:3-hydroxyisobutyrate dehydrogenase-like beta-hydroxyacid dehydrogenase
MPQASNRKIVMIGFGEAGQALVEGWRRGAAPRVAAYDIRAGEAELAEAAVRHSVELHGDPGAALADAQVAVCLVTADQALSAAETCATHLMRDLLWLDGNSCSPGTKRQSAAVIEAAGGHYVDMAIMAPIRPNLNRTPALLAGPHAQAAADLLDGLDMNLNVAGSQVGDASIIKMLRSVMIKGLEALTAECLLAARRSGVEDEVLGSLQASDPGFNWRQRGAHSLERMLVHGTRRAAEMREVALTLRELGLPDRMASATVEWQAQIGALGLPAALDDLPARLDAILVDL